MDRPAVERKNGEELLFINSSLGPAMAIVLASTVAATGGDAQSACGEAAINDFRARLAIMQQESPVLPVESTIAVRRLEEEFCLHFVRCTHSDSNSFPFRASFESCLHDEAMEKFEGEGRKE
jgi:hypothetical protein